MHSYVFVVKSPYDEETDGGIHAHYGKEDLYLGLPGKCDYADEMDVNEMIWTSWKMATFSESFLLVSPDLLDGSTFSSAYKMYASIYWIALTGPHFFCRN